MLLALKMRKGAMSQGMCGWLLKAAKVKRRDSPLDPQEETVLQTPCS